MHDNYLDEFELIFLKQFSLGKHKPSSDGSINVPYDELQDLICENDIRKILSFLSFIEKEVGIQVSFSVGENVYTQERLLNRPLNQEQVVEELQSSHLLQILISFKSISELESYIKGNEYFFITALLDRKPKKYYVDEWNRPMGYLLNLNVKFNNFTMDKVVNFLNNYISLFEQGKLHKPNVIVYNKEAHLKLFLKVLEIFKHFESNNIAIDDKLMNEYARLLPKEIQPTAYYRKLEYFLLAESNGYIKIASLEKVKLKRNDKKTKPLHNIDPIITPIKWKINFSVLKGIEEIKKIEIPELISTESIKELEVQKQDKNPLDSEKTYKLPITSQAPYEVTYTNNEVWINTKIRSYKIKQTMDEKDPDLFMGYVIYHAGEEITPKTLNNYLSEKKLKSRPLKRSFPTLISELGFIGDELKKAFFPTRDSEKVVFRKMFTDEDIKANNINEELLINQIIEAEKLCLDSEQAKV